MAKSRPSRRLLKRRPSVLVLCEGSNTEPTYFDALVREFGLTAVSIPRNHKTDTLGLVKDAIAALKGDSDLSFAFVVVDCDTHPSFVEAAAVAERSPYFNSRLRLFRSYPCFETWLISHFELCRAPMTSEQALAKLRQIYPEYEKSSVKSIENIVDRLPQAINNSRNALADAHATGEPNSSSEIHLLVAEFIKMGT